MRYCLRLTKAAPYSTHRAAPVRKRRESWVGVLTPMKRFPAVGRLQEACASGGKLDGHIARRFLPGAALWEATPQLPDWPGPRLRVTPSGAAEKDSGNTPVRLQLGTGRPICLFATLLKEEARKRFPCSLRDCGRILLGVQFAKLLVDRRGQPPKGSLATGAEAAARSRGPGSRT